MLFSVLLPTHNHPDTLALSIRSLLAQEMRDFELLVVGDGCDRQSASIIQSFDDARIRFFDLPKAPDFGYANRNLALKEARGEFIAYATDDDIVFPKHLSNLHGLFANPAVQWGYCRPLFVTVRGVILPEFVNLKLATERNVFMERRNMMASGCVAHRRSCFDDVGYWPESGKAGDWDLWKRLLRQYGPQGIGFSRAPTMLHFSTDRDDENSRDMFPKWLGYLKGIANASAHWPPFLRLKGDDEGESLQAVALKLVESDPVYPQKVSAGVLLLMDHFAWSISQSHIL